MNNKRKMERTDLSFKEVEKIPITNELQKKANE